MKKKLLTASVLVLCAVALVVGSVFATVAYLTASSGVSNVFTVGSVGITMYETKVNPDGTVDDDTVTTDTNSYHLVPNTTYVKNPTIKITSLLEQDEMYLFVKSSNQIRSAEAGNVDENSPKKTMRQQMRDNGWVEFVRSQDGVEIVWVYGTRDVDTGVITPTAVNPTSTQQNDPSKPAGIFVLCEEFTIHEKANVSLYGAASVNFTAFAIQTSAMDTTETAWEAIKATYPYACGIVNPVNPYDTTLAPYAPAPGVKEPAKIPLAN